MNLNKNYENLEQSYLFSTIAKKVNEYIANNPDKKVIRLGIGDVTKPLCKSVIEAMHKAIDEETDNILLYIENDMTDFEKVMTVHDYMVIHYDYDYTYENHSISI